MEKNILHNLSVLLPEVYKMMRGESSGFTVSLINQKVPKTGYMVSYPDGIRSKYMPSFPEIEDFVVVNADKLSQHNHFIGGWKDENEYYIDVSVRIAGYNMAMMIARKFEQKAIYNLATGESIYL